MLFCVSSALRKIQQSLLQIFNQSGDPIDNHSNADTNSPPVYLMLPMTCNSTQVIMDTYQHLFRLRPMLKECEKLLSVKE